MDAVDVRFRLLKASPERRRGAMRRRNLGSEVLVFSYSRPAPRLFHTFLCPPLRILAFNDEGRPIVDGIWPGNMFVILPPTRLVVECDPAVDLTAADFRSIAAIANFLDRKE